MRQLHEIILASGSPRRRELLTQAGLTFTVKTADVDETPTQHSPAAVVEELSRRKALAVAEQYRYGERLVVAADTIVAYQGEILGKPRDAEDAVRMLRELSGHRHEVYTGVTILLTDREGKILRSGTQDDRARSDEGERPEDRILRPGTQDDRAGITFSNCTGVRFYTLSDAEIKDYVASGEPMDKAGAYGIQGLGARLVEKIEGDYNNVVGFPLAHFLRVLEDMGELTWNID